MSRNNVSIAEFLSLSGVSETEFLRMLQRGELPFDKGADNELLIDIDKVTTVSLANRAGASASEQFDEEELALIQEMVASELLAALEPLLAEAVELAVDWHLALADDSEPALPLANPPSDD